MTPLSPVAKRLVRLLFLIFLGAAGTASAWTGALSPHDTHHLIVLRPAQFRATGGQPLKLVPDSGAIFAKEAVPLGGPVVATINVRHAGRYVLWVRCGQKKALATPIAAELRRGDAAVLKGALLDGPGEPGRGGPAGFEAYSERATKRGPGLDLKARKGDEDGTEAAADEVLAELGKGGAKAAWINLARVESSSGERPFHWWKIGAADLTPGVYELRLAPQGTIPADRVPLVDAAFLTTFGELVYPYAGDVDAPKASYVRFRIEKAPPAGLAISAALRIHSDPWGTPRVWLNPSGLSVKEREAHAKAGFTRWFRLQDIERAPAFGAAECCLLLQVAPAAEKGGRSPFSGATQFAAFPYQDFVLREIAWNEPDGLSLSMATDFESRLHLLRTFRDHERENYERALAATHGQLFPLTRGDLYFTNSWGAAGGAAYDYMLKTLRLLGFNNAGVAKDPIRARQLYGWTSHAGHYWPPAFVPYDEEDARRKYDQHYAHFFDKEREFYEGVPIYQIADEPGEIAKTEVSAPLWAYDEKAAKWVDPVGGSDLSTRALLSNCVVEGKVEQHGDAIGFRVAIDNPEKPTKSAYWESGRVGPSYTVNVAAGRVGLPTDSRSTMNRPGGSVGRTPTPFKIILEGDAAALYLNGQLIHQHANLPEKGAVGFSGGPKAIAELRIRAIRKDEHIVARSPVGAAKELKLTPGEDEDLSLEPAEKGEKAKAKPLKEFVEQDWVPSGGMPQAHAGFRKWAAAQGLRPELFGKKSWDEVRLLTIPSLAKAPEDARRFYWSRRYNGLMTPLMFGLAADAIAKHAPNPRMKGFVALSGHALYFPSEMPLDMFALAAHGGPLIPGISDWMSLGGWRWDSHQAVAYSVAPYNAGARRWEGEAPAEPGRKNGSAGASPSQGAAGDGAEPVSYPMMHCVWPAVIRSYTMLANNVKTISYFNYGPAYAVTEGFWSDSDWAYEAVHLTDNHAALVDDVLATARMRPSRVALLYARSTEYWKAQASFADKRAAFLALSHEYFQPELVTEEQIADGALKHYDALYVLEPWVASAARERIADWVRAGGVLCAYADALTRNEYNEPCDLLSRVASINRTLPPEGLKPSGGYSAAYPPEGLKPSGGNPVMTAVPGETDFRPHAVVPQGIPSAFEAPGARVRAKYSDGRPAWLERSVEKGKVVYLGHRPGLTYTAKAIRRPGYHDVWADTGRASLTLPLIEAQVERELILSEPLIMASALSSDAGTVVILYNMHPTPRRNLRIDLREPQRPHSVEVFGDAFPDAPGARGGPMPQAPERSFASLRMTGVEARDRLAPSPFEYRDGRVTMVLPKLAGGLMILVRRRPAPPDDRLAKMKRAAEGQLASADGDAVAAGAWFAGFFPDWGLAPKLVPFLGHARWEVRRAAAESLGRLGHAPAADALFAALKKETDAHALGDEVLALARLGDPRAAEAVRQGLAHREPFVRRQAVAAAALLGAMPGGGGAPGGSLPDLLATALDAGLRDPDLRVRREAIPLAVLLDSRRAAALAGEAFAEGGRDPLERPFWADALARDGSVFEEYAGKGFPGGDALLLAVASRRAEPRLAQALAARSEALARLDAAAFVAAAIRQRDPALARALFAKRAGLPRAVTSHLTLILANAFEVRLGDVLEDWQEWLRR